MTTMTFDRLVQVRITSEEYDLLKQMAEDDHRTVSAFLRIVVRNELKRAGEGVQPSP